MGIGYVDGAYNRATGTRSAFDGLSDALEREGHPRMISLSGDREPEVQERLWYERMTLSPGGRKVYGYRWWQGQKWYQIHPDTVAPPRSSNHEARRSNDLKWPYNSDTLAARRAEELAPRFNITREGKNFRELWHWTHWGSLGRIETPASTGGTTTPTPAPAPSILKELEDMDKAVIVHLTVNKKTTWLLIGATVPGGYRATNAQETANAWAHIYGPSKKLKDQAELDVALREAKALAASWLAQQKKIHS
ncbi:hypothetical protein [Microbacterium sp. K36]|uniref:hypothetical protein n=1 Tax=Microbacterium sp. K36 TaxID=2305439 RepID=UPI00109C4AE7|nr:hypothetical protein [Microbacterium sp. K36]